MKFVQGINVLCLIRREWFYIVWLEEMLNYYIFGLLQLSELWASFSNNCGIEF